MRIEIKCECKECENNKDGCCNYVYGITIGNDGMCQDYYENHTLDLDIAQAFKKAGIEPPESEHWKSLGVMQPYKPEYEKCNYSTDELIDRILPPTIIHEINGVPFDYEFSIHKGWVGYCMTDYSIYPVKINKDINKALKQLLLWTLKHHQEIMKLSNKIDKI